MRKTRRRARTDRDTPWNPAERRLLARLRSPEAIQAFLDGIPYNDEKTCRSPRRVMRDKKAHCFEGALFAAAALAQIGHPPVLLDLGAVRDDDHVLAIFRQKGAYGALGKSNFTGLRYRAPVYRSLRELAMSYFDDYFNTLGERTLRSYSRRFRLTERVHSGWRTAEEDLDDIGDRLTAQRHFPLLAPGAARTLARVDPRLLESGLLGANAKGLYRP
ncbi:MAG: hypothetical protein HY720_00050 [Planctomycetes bacterium]|nr:hypothetical protein [Planctomycetota bacterium]